MGCHRMQCMTAPQPPRWQPSCCCRRCAGLAGLMPIRPACIDCRSAHLLLDRRPRMQLPCCIGGVPYPRTGDYVDRGAWGVELLTLLVCLKLALPACVHLLRGNHESAMCTKYYGFMGEVQAKYAERSKVRAQTWRAGKERGSPRGGGEGGRWWCGKCSRAKHDPPFCPPPSPPHACMPCSTARDAVKVSNTMHCCRGTKAGAWPASCRAGPVPGWWQES